jgi:hypothetical protein
MTEWNCPGLSHADDRAGQGYGRGSGDGQLA